MEDFFVRHWRVGELCSNLINYPLLVLQVVAVPENQMLMMNVGSSSNIKALATKVLEDMFTFLSWIPVKLLRFVFVGSHNCSISNLETISQLV